MIDIDIEAAAWTDALPAVEDIVRRAVAAVGADRPLGSIAILLADDPDVRDLNRRFRDQDRATNILSFPAAATAKGYLGDLALAFGVCAAEAEAQEKKLGDHLSHLVVHGVLHLLGYDHESDTDAERMESLERDILAELGIADPYAGEDHVDPER